MSQICPSNGCRDLTAETKRIDKLYDLFDKSISQVIKANNELKISLTSTEIILKEQTARLNEGNRKFDLISEHIQEHSTDIAVLKTKCTSAKASTAQATTISTIASGIAIAILEYLRRK